MMSAASYHLSFIAQNHSMIHSRNSRKNFLMIASSRIMVVIFMMSIITTVESLSFPVHTVSSSPFKFLSSTISAMDTLNYNVLGRTRRWKKQTNLNQESRIHIAHYTQPSLIRVRRSYQQTIDNEGGGTRKNSDSDKINHNKSSDSDHHITPSVEHHLSSSSTLYGTNVAHEMVTKNIQTEEHVADINGSYTITDSMARNSTQKYVKEQRKDSSTSKSREPIDVDEKTNPTQSHKLPREEQKTKPGENGITVAEIVVISIISVILSSSIFASNLLVMIPFSRCTRIRTPSNYLLLTLSISDFIIGIIVIPVVTITTILRYATCNFSFFKHILFNHFEI